MRVGIHSGPVVVGTLGNDLRVEFKAVGDTVNLASRMEELASPGTTYVTGDTFKLTEGLFRFEALGGKEIKGKEEVVNVYQVIAPSTRRTRFDVSAERGLTPLVGRERELELLLDGFERAKAGRGQAFSIVAEAGIGKSRLLYEFRKAVASEDITFLEGRCLSYGRGIAYHPIIDILKANFDVQQDDTESEIMEKVRRGLETLQIDEASTLPYLLELLSVKDSGIDSIAMSPEGKKDRIIDVLRGIPLRGSELRPLIMAFEDLHWVDKSSEDVLKYLLESIPGARILLLFTYRPEFVHTWGGRSYHSQVTLNRLSNRESLSMVTHLLGTEDVSSDLEELILDKTEGIPFFIEEFLKSLRDLNIIERKENKVHLAKDIQDITIPSTIQDVIMARIDSLPEGAKEVLQTGSVVEREFTYELIERVTGISQDQLLSHLSVLKNTELLYERGIYPQTTYIFKHALTQEVVYDSILTKRKKQLHEEIGNAIEEVCRENIGEHYAVLSKHFIESENYDRGAEYSKLTARGFEKAASFSDAIAYAEKRVACLERLPETDDLQRRIIDARTTLGLYCTQTSRLIEARKAINPIVSIAESHGYKRRLGQIYTILGLSDLAVDEDNPKALKRLREAISLSEETNDPISSFFGTYWLGFALSNNCEFEKGYTCLERVLNVNVATNTLWGIVIAKSAITLNIHFFQGKAELAYQTAHGTIDIAEQSGDIVSKAHAYGSHTVSCYAKGFLEEAIGYALKSANLHLRCYNPYTSAVTQTCLGELYFLTGEYDKSKYHHNAAVSFLEETESHRSLINWNALGFAVAKVMNNEKDIDLQSLHNHITDNRLVIYEGSVRRYLGIILLNIDDQHMSEAQDWIEKAIEADEKNGMMLHLGWDYAVYAELFKRKGDLSKAKENLTKAIDIYKECGADGWVEKAEKELALLS